MPAPDPGFEAFLERTRDEPVYVILGVQGSGTNFLGRLLRRFYGFSLLRDRAYVVEAARRLGPAPTRAAIEREIRQFTRRAFPPRNLLRTGHRIVDYAAFPGIMAELRPDRIRSGADFARLIHAYRAYALGTTHMAVKSDDLWACIGALADALPLRRTILITRDFRDNLVSITGKDFGPRDPLRAAMYVKERFGPYAAEFRRCGDRGLHVRFETLVRSPLDFVSDFTRHFGLTPSIDVQDAMQQFRVRPNRTQRWRTLPPHALAWCEGLLYDELVAFGYEPITESPRLPPRRALLLAEARDTVLRVPQKMRSVIRGLKG